MSATSNGDAAHQKTGQAQQVSPHKRSLTYDDDGDQASKVKKSRLILKQTEGDDRETNNNATDDKETGDTKSCWGYDDCNGPDTWSKSYPDAEGKQQSPIDLRFEAADYDPNLGPLSISYAEENNIEMENTGLSFKMNVSGDSSLMGGPLDDKFKLVQFHFHWGHDNKCGSEHRVEGQMYPAELHLVHYNADKYKSFAEAVTECDGLAVLGIFLKVGEADHPGFQALSDNACKVKCGGSNCNCNKDFNPACLLPEDTSKYWTYDGSLTTPPCCESVKWIVLAEEIEVSEAQINSMRCLCCDKNGCKPIPNNYRPPLPLGDRKLRISFPKPTQLLHKAS